jgi:hypothetical protein
MINITITDPRSITKGVKTSVANQVKEFSKISYLHCKQKLHTGVGEQDRDG